MESNHRIYDYEASSTRLDAYLDSSNDQFQEVSEIPSRDRLTYSNGFYVEHCTALFVDIRGSSEMPNKYTRPRLAKIYRSYISEVIAVINGDPKCAEVNIVGDAVYGIFNTPYKADMDSVFSRAYGVNSRIKLLNYKLRIRNIDPIKIGIGIDYGRLLMVQASGLNEIVWMGHAVNGASNLCHHGNETFSDHTIMVSGDVYSNLNNDNKNLLSYNYARQCYHGDVVNLNMDNWYNLNCL